MILLAATAAALVLAALVKAPCLSHAWDGYQNERLCYNDLQALYYTRGFDQKGLPYLELDLEYPVVTGLIIYLASLPSDDADEFWAWNALLLAPFAFGSTLLLHRLAPDPRRIAFWAAGPPLILYAFHNWDLLAVFFTLLAFHAHQRDRPLVAGAALALGASAKFYPALFGPFFLLTYLRTAGGMAGRPARFLIGLLAAGILVNAPFLLANPDGFLYTYRFHLERGTTFESIFFVVPQLLTDAKVMQLTFEDLQPAYNWAAALLLVAAAAAIGWARWRGRTGLVHACLAVLLVFLLLSKVFSVQYALWILPFFALLPMPTRKFVALEATDVAVYVSVFQYFTRLDEGVRNPLFAWLAAATLARTAVLVWLLVAAVARRRPTRAPPTPPPSPLPTDTALGAPEPSSEPGPPETRTRGGQTHSEKVPERHANSLVPTDVADEITMTVQQPPNCE